MKRHIRFFSVFIVATLLVALVLWMNPEQAGIILYKVALIFLAGVIGYVLDRITFPYARPDSYLDWPWEEEKRLGFRTLNPNHRVSLGYKYVFAATLIRRAIIMGATMLAMALI